MIDLLKKDDNNAFSEIYSRYAASLVGFASSKLFDLEDSRDIIHDVFVKLWQERRELKVDRDLKAYLFKLTRYRIVDKIRKNITREEYAAMVNSLAVDYEVTIDQEMAAKEITHIIETSLNKLSPRVKEVYLLSREENLSIAEIADKLQVSEQTVKNQLSTALKYLRASLSGASAVAFMCWLS
ncbi:RNA polymerase sigma-70 factor (ECF subfamily) [Dyadobacter sp. BE34]|uniref:RNA polymerase sigma-70 factor (ECF subfamily) n=1 Tax=Dyadobacter fermentans TaxID=94254 RepID=A0ABU1R0P2_9BACT|nr:MULTISPECIES: RNA polymerase sigma-70 factor [Dyadobacter]MDR6806967.1 RNA polymerase sigma-70 factor (ECF subfamily) [Dyadobacter fermentans]MDR7044709.1 RNA polymerase sigma-70 factor (ECF subfamily) [Dyadobacter sp. BE242]MDR7199019.1 RNA polymerase sigma-70 factor (ECF subfamily) [Dyadobacter sp. BE34]MDR7216981.1 RNA polymerase sigma-70 factor (ECF subfamily) [Dyadobacter sp. BE31]MDR7263493.1 RNA polymerase sigma-70 factor (ECF subfamily) [Dyadobacter sp. BE32]